jgi:hypothetical protein
MSFLRDGWGENLVILSELSVATPFVKAKSALPMGVNRAVSLNLREPLDPQQQ